MRPLLALLVGAESALVPDIRGGGAELAIGANRKHHDIARTIVCHQDVFPCAVKG